jgi:hypothetical protein
MYKNNARLETICTTKNTTNGSIPSLLFQPKMYRSICILKPQRRNINNSIDSWGQIPVRTGGGGGGKKNLNVGTVGFSYFLLYWCVNMALRQAFLFRGVRYWKMHFHYLVSHIWKGIIDGQMNVHCRRRRSILHVQVETEGNTKMERDKGTETEGMKRN